MSVRILHGDCREVLRTLPDASVDSVVTDPPYHLKNKGGGPHNKTPNAYSRGKAGAGSGGFMGMAWDGGDIAQNPAVWIECLRVLKPGGYLLAFSGTRTQHRMVCAIEDAGFEIRDQIGDAIASDYQVAQFLASLSDEQRRAFMRCIDESPMGGQLAWVFGSGFPKSHNGEWGGTALKPAWEPICMARKPLAGTVEANWREHGTGALNIDGCRIEAEPMPPNTGKGAMMRRKVDEVREARPPAQPHDLGRWPANLIHDGSDEVFAAFPRAPGQIADAKRSGERKTANVYGVMRYANGRDGEASADSGNEGAVGFKMKPGARRLDEGSAARFFYCAKADRADRNEGLQGMPTRDLNWSSGTQAPGTFQSPNTNRAAQNYHPTVKPTDLMRYLCRLVTPKGGTVLDPFMGSGSTLKAAELEGFSAIGIELDAAYIDIARRRIAADAPLFAEVAA